jgi:hypothetical protein
VNGSVELRFSGTSCSLKSCSLTAKNNVIVQRDVHRLLQNGGGGQIGKLELDMSVQIVTRSGGVTLQAEDIVLLSSLSTQGQPSFLYINSAGSININASEKVLLTESVRMVSGGQVIISGPGPVVPRVKVVEITGAEIMAGKSTEHAVRADGLKITDSVRGPALVQFDGGLSLDIGSGSTITDSSLLVSGKLSQPDKQILIVNSPNKRHRVEIEAGSGVAATTNVMKLADASLQLREIWYAISDIIPTADFQKSFDNKFYTIKDPPTSTDVCRDFGFIVDSNGKNLGYIRFYINSGPILMNSSNISLEYLNIGEYFTPFGILYQYVDSVKTLSPVSKFTAFRQIGAPPKKLNFELPMFTPLADWSEVATAATYMIEGAVLAIEPASTVPLLTV